MSDIGDMRISLPPGTVLQGKKGKYRVINIICLSERSVTVLCSDEKGRKWRLKLYNGESSVSEEAQVAIVSNPIQGVVVPYDIGDYSERRFSVFPEMDATDTGQFPVSIHVLVNKLIPKMAFIVNQYHKKGILLRDICPEHILYKPDEETIAYCGFNNAALLRGKATITRETGYGQHDSYLAPEVEKYGYSTCSDYFSLGVTILTILKGGNPIANVSRQDFMKQLLRGSVPGIDVQHLRNTSYEMYSAEDRVLYLVLGLLIPDPGERWEYGEIRCWSNNQRIPLVQKGRRIKYQFSEPCMVGRKECWNEKQLANTLASDKTARNDATVKNISSFAKKQGLKSADSIDKYCSDVSLSPMGKIFRCIYELDPTIKGLWWEGRVYSDTGNLVNDVKNGSLQKESLSQLLKDRGISFFEKSRNRIGISGNVRLSEMEDIESLEKSEPGKGVQRCLMLFAADANSRFFMVEGRRYNSLAQLLDYYKNDGRRIRELSNGILLDSSFQAWLWARGMERAGEEAAQYAKRNPEQSFYMLLSISERAENDESVKKLARSLFLRWGDYAPVVWMCANVRYYSVSNPSYRPLYDSLSKVRFSVNDPLDKLSNQANGLVNDYQTFVGRTLNNPFLLENEQVEDIDCGYIPKYESGYFCTIWRNGLEVCPAFLKSVGEEVKKEDLGDWLKKAEEEEIVLLNEKASRLPDYSYDSKNIPSEENYVAACNNNLGFSVFMLLVACVLLMMTVNQSLMAGIAAFAVAVMFPIYSFTWYYKKKARIEIWLRNKQDIQSKQSTIDDRIRKVRDRSSAIFSGIISGQVIKCRTVDEAIIVSGLSLESPENLDLSTGQKIVAYISTYGYVMLAAIYLGGVYSSFMAASIYAVIYGIAAPYILNRRRFVNSCLAWSLATLTVTFASILGGTAFGNSFFVTMNWIPVVCLIVIVVIFLILMFC